MVRPKPVAQDLLADLPTDVDAVSTQPMPPSKPRRTKKAQPKTKATEVEAKDALPISKLAESSKSQPSAGKRRAESQPSESTQPKKPRSSQTTTSGSKKSDVPWAPQITLEDRPIMTSESADDINVGVALSTALLLPGDLERNAGYSEYENYALMLQHSAGAATKAQTLAEEKVESAEAIKTVAESQKKEAEARAAQAKKELQEALATKEAEIKEVDEKANAQGVADVTEDYKLQVSQAEDESESEAEDENDNDDEALVRKSKDAAEAKSFPSTKQVINLTQDEEDGELEEVSKEAVPGQLSSDLLLAERSLDKTIAEIDAELAAEKVAEVVSQETSEVQTQTAPGAEESQL
ncbi:triadin-like [Camellia sinensis]|uniref:triadin-like n=1 Tax=Camellia sinensis TaxID=4442 RepID=UPI001036E82E|nr:triadin-like [Camellia sinensis]